MSELFYPLISLGILVTTTYLVSKHTINTIYTVLKKILKKDGIVFSVLSIFFFPGTLLHELSHAFMARLLLLKVFEIKLLPEWKHNSIKLGMVTYAKRDKLSSVIVGIAPIIGGICLLVWIASLNIFPNADWRINAAMGYLIVVISTTMFSSKQDLVDVLYALPLIAIILTLLYFIFSSIDISYFVPILHVYLTQINQMLLISLGCHMAVLLVLYVTKYIL